MFMKFCYCHFVSYFQKISFCFNILYFRLWVSPRLPSIVAKNESDSTYDSETNFKKDLLYYLESYKLPVLQPWIEKVTNADFTKVKYGFSYFKYCCSSQSRKKQKNFSIIFLAFQSILRG